MSAEKLTVKGGARMRQALAQLRDASGKATQVRIGYLENATYSAGDGEGNGLHVAQVAFWNEFGTSRAPARPFMRQTIRANQDEWGDDLARYLKAAGFDSEVALQALGIRVRDQIVDAIQRWPGDNAPSTIARKGFDHGLVHRRTMKDATDFEVVRRGA